MGGGGVGVGKRLRGGERGVWVLLSVAEFRLGTVLGGAMTAPEFEGEADAVCGFTSANG